MTLIAAPHIPLAHQFVKILVVRQPTPGKKYHVFNTHSLSARRHLPSLLHIERQRFLAQHVQPSIQSRHGNRIVHIVGDGDNQRL